MSRHRPFFHLDIGYWIFSPKIFNVQHPTPNFQVKSKTCHRIVTNAPTKRLGASQVPVGAFVRMRTGHAAFGRSLSATGHRVVTNAPTKRLGASPVPVGAFVRMRAGHAAFGRSLSAAGHRVVTNAPTKRLGASPVPVGAFVRMRAGHAAFGRSLSAAGHSLIFFKSSSNAANNFCTLPSLRVR